MRLKKKKRIIWFKAIISALGFSAIFSLIWSAFWWSDYHNTLIIKNVVFSNTVILDKQNYRNTFGDLIGASIDEINLTRVTELVESHPYVLAARVSHRYPGTIMIEIMERTPIAILNTQPMVMLDEEGYILPDMENMGDFLVPSLSNFNPAPELYPAGEKVLSIKVKESIEWLSHLRREYSFLYDNLSEIRLVSDNDIELILAEEPTKILLGNEDLWTKIEILKQFRLDLKPNKELTDFSYLDMRYINQIIAKDRRS